MVATATALESHSHPSHGVANSTLSRSAAEWKYSHEQLAASCSYGCVLLEDQWSRDRRRQSHKSGGNGLQLPGMLGAGGGSASRVIDASDATHCRRQHGSICLRCRRRNHERRQRARPHQCLRIDRCRCAVPRIEERCS